MAPTQEALYAGLDLDLSWSERELPERERTKHVHRLHPYLGKFIPQLVEVLLERYVPAGGRVLDPFAGSGTTNSSWKRSYATPAPVSNGHVAGTVTVTVTVTVPGSRERTRPKPPFRRTYASGTLRMRSQTSSLGARSFRTTSTQT